MNNGTPCVLRSYFYIAMSFLCALALFYLILITRRLLNRLDSKWDIESGMEREIKSGMQEELDDIENNLCQIKTYVQEILDDIEYHGHNIKAHRNKVNKSRGGPPPRPQTPAQLHFYAPSVTEDGIIRERRAFLGACKVERPDEGFIWFQMEGHRWLSVVLSRSLQELLHYPSWNDQKVPHYHYLFTIGHILEHLDTKLWSLSIQCLEESKKWLSINPPTLCNSADIKGTKLVDLMLLSGQDVTYGTNNVKMLIERVEWEVDNWVWVHGWEDGRPRHQRCHLHQLNFIQTSNRNVEECVSTLKSVKGQIPRIVVEGLF